MVYHTFLGQFQPSFSISGLGDGFKKRYAFLIIIYGAISIAARVMSPERERAIALGMEALPAVPGAARAPQGPLGRHHCWEGIDTGF